MRSILLPLGLLLTTISAQSKVPDPPLMGTTLSFLNSSQQIDKCPAASVLPSFHFQYPIDKDFGGTICLDIEDLFTHPNQTNTTDDVTYSLQNANLWSASQNFSGLRYTQADQNPNQNMKTGKASYILYFYMEKGCLQGRSPYMQFSCIAEQAKCFQFPFNLGSIGIRAMDDEGDCALNKVLGERNAAPGLSPSMGLTIVIIGLGFLL